LLGDYLLSKASVIPDGRCLLAVTGVLLYIFSGGGIIMSGFSLYLRILHW
jgi:hypothetical protein